MQFCDQKHNMHDHTLLNKTIQVKTKPILESAKTKSKTKLDMTAKFGRITHNNGHFAVEGHSRSPIFVPIESSYTASYIKTILRQVLCIKSLEFTNLLEIYTVGVSRSLCRRSQLNIVFVNCPQLWFCQPLLRNSPRKLPNFVK